MFYTNFSGLDQEKLVKFRLNLVSWDCCLKGCAKD